MKDLLAKCKFVPRKGKGQGYCQRPTELELIEALNRGGSVKGAAELLGVSCTSVTNYKIYYGMADPKPAVKINKVDLVRLYTSGENQRDLADRFNCSQSTVSRILRLAGVKTRGRGQHNEINSEDVFKIHAKGGWTHEAIALELGCSQSHVSNILNGKVA